MSDTGVIRTYNKGVLHSAAVLCEQSHLRCVAKQNDPANSVSIDYYQLDDSTMLTFFVYLFGTLLGMIGLLALGVGLFFVCGWVGMDGLFNLGEPRGELTCWHCGQETRAGSKHCSHCGQELQ